MSAWTAENLALNLRIPQEIEMRPLTLGEVVHYAFHDNSEAVLLVIVFAVAASLVWILYGPFDK